MSSSVYPRGRLLYNVNWDARQIDCECKVGVGYWSIGGEVASTTCCGDDTGEYKNLENTYSDSIAFDNNEDACCNSASDCVAGSTCYTARSAGTTDGGLNVGGNDNYAHCYNAGGVGKWLECDQSDFMDYWCGNVCGPAKGVRSPRQSGTPDPNWNAVYAGEAGVGEYPDLTTYGCCGDDLSENYNYFKVYPSNSGEGYGKYGDDDSSDDACCNSANDCIYGGNCYSDGYYDLDSDGKTDMRCYTGTNNWWINVDYHSSYCDAAVGAGHWNLGGDATSEDGYYTSTGSRPDYCTIGSGGHPSQQCCCGDDANEYKKTRLCDNANGNINPNPYSCTTSSSDDACCNVNTDCVYNSGCYSSGTHTTDVDGNGDAEYCASGIWYDCYDTGDCDPAGEFAYTESSNACSGTTECHEACSSNDCIYQRNQGYGDCDNNNGCYDSSCYQDTSFSANFVGVGVCDNNVGAICTNGASDGYDICVNKASYCLIDHDYDDAMADCSGSNCLISNGGTFDLDNDGDLDYCSGGVWQDCNSDSHCPSGTYCNGGDCVVCTSAQCADHPNCRDGTAGCCDSHSDCSGAGNDFCQFYNSGDENAKNDASDDGDVQAGYVELATQYTCAPAKYLNRGTEAVSWDLGNLNTFYSRTQTYGSDADWWQFAGDGMVTAETSYSTSDSDLCFIYNYDPCSLSATSDVVAKNAQGTRYDLGDIKQALPITSGCSSNWIWIDLSSRLGSSNGLFQIAYFAGNSDYTREWQFGWKKGEVGATDGTNSYWCCDDSTDCVHNAPSQGNRVAGDPDSESSGCYNAGVFHNAGGGDGVDLEECRNSIWYAQDSDSTACNNAGNDWNIGGEVAATTCCGDDANEYKKTCGGHARSCDGSSDNIACCNINTDCVYDNVCYSHGTIRSVFKCNAGNWDLNTCTLSGDQFQIKDTSSNTIGVIDESGDFILYSSTVNFNTAPPVSPTNSFIIKQGATNKFSFALGSSYITNNINMNQGTVSDANGNDFVVKAASTPVAKFEGDTGNIYLKGYMCTPNLS
jgi:hypothetical protein